MHYRRDLFTPYFPSKINRRRVFWVASIVHQSKRKPIIKLEKGAFMSVEVVGVLLESEPKLIREVPHGPAYDGLGDKVHRAEIIEGYLCDHHGTFLVTVTGITAYP